MYLEFDESLPVYTQIIDGFKRQIFGGRLDAGARIPPVRQLAERLGVNPNTLQKSLIELERCGLVKARRTSGRFVTTDEREIIRQRQEMLGAVIARFVREMDELGCSYEEIVAVVAGHYGAPAPLEVACGLDHELAPTPPVNVDLEEEPDYTGAGPYTPRTAIDLPATPVAHAPYFDDAER